MMKRVLIIFVGILLIFSCFYGCQKEPVQTKDGVNTEVLNSDTHIKSTYSFESSNKADIIGKALENINESFTATNSETDIESEITDAGEKSPQTTKDVPAVMDTVFNYNVKKDGIILEVSAPEKISKNSEFYVVAKVTNCSDDAIEYWVPFTEGLHKEIKVTIKDENGKEFTDRDTFGVGYDAGLKKVLLEPNESYTETICFITGWAKADFLNPGVENGDITYFDEGTYTGTAVFDWDTEEDIDSISLEFPIIVV